MVMAIDPGVMCGYAALRDGQYTAQTLLLAELYRLLHASDAPPGTEVRIEWGQGIRTTYGEYGKARESKGLNRSIGINHGIGASLAAYCEARGWRVVHIPPSGSGRKALARQRAHALGHTRISQHAADALLLLP